MNVKMKTMKTILMRRKGEELLWSVDPKERTATHCLTKPLNVLAGVYWASLASSVGCVGLELETGLKESFALHVGVSAAIKERIGGSPSI